MDSVIKRVAAVFGALLESDSTADARGFMQSVSPGARLLGTLFLLFAGAVAGSFAALLGIAVLFSFVALLSRVKFSTLLLRITPAVLLTVLVTAPALLSFGSGHAGWNGSLSIFYLRVSYRYWFRRALRLVIPCGKGGGNGFDYHSVAAYEHESRSL